MQEWKCWTEFVDFKGYNEVKISIIHLTCSCYQGNVRNIKILLKQFYFILRHLKKKCHQTLQPILLLCIAILQRVGIYDVTFLRREFWFDVGGIANFLKQSIDILINRENIMDSKWSFDLLWILTNVWSSTLWNSLETWILIFEHIDEP